MFKRATVVSLMLGSVLVGAGLGVIGNNLLLLSKIKQTKYQIFRSGCLAGAYKVIDTARIRIEPEDAVWLDDQCVIISEAVLGAEEKANKGFN